LLPLQPIKSDRLFRYNSAIYASIPTYTYQGFAVSQAFVDSPKCENCTNLDIPDPDVRDSFGVGKTLAGKMLENLWTKSRNGSLDRLNPAECIAAYGTLVQSTRRNLLVVIANEHVDYFEEVHTLDGYRDLHTPNLLMTWESLAPYSLTDGERGSYLEWMCEGLPVNPDVQCSSRLAELSPQNWTIHSGCTSTYTSSSPECHPARWPVEYCLSESAEDRCRIHFSPLVAGVVTALNLCESSLSLTCLYRISGYTITTKTFS
jgi:hypothetical protein